MLWKLLRTANDAASRPPAWRRRQLIEAQVHGQRADQVGPLLRQLDAVQGRALPHVTFLEVLLVILDRHVQAAGRDDASFVHGVLVRVLNADAFVVHVQIGKVEAGDQLQDLDRGLQAPLQIRAAGLSVAASRRAVESAHVTLIGWMARPPSTSSNSLPIFFSRKPRSTASRWSAAMLMPLS